MAHDSGGCPEPVERDGMDKAIAASGRFHVVVRQAHHDMKRAVTGRNVVY